MTMTNKYFMCCEKCFEEIGKIDTRAARFWMDLCAMRLEYGEIVHVKSPDLPELRKLELMGFIVSTEKPNNLSLRIKGHCHNEDGEHFFCIKEGQHD